MALMRRLAALGAAAEAARRYAHNNPDKAQRYIDQAAAFADKRTKGKYSRQIGSASSKASELAIGHGGGTGGSGSMGSPGPSGSTGSTGTSTPPPPPPTTDEGGSPTSSANG